MAEVTEVVPAELSEDGQAAGEATAALLELGNGSDRDALASAEEFAGVELVYDRAQDSLAFEAARAEEAAAQGAEQTTQEMLWGISRDEEARAQGVESVRNTTQKVLFRTSRIDEATSEFLEAQTPSDGMNPKEGLDQVALLEEQKEPVANQQAADPK